MKSEINISTLILTDQNFTIYIIRTNAGSRDLDWINVYKLRSTDKTFITFKIHRLNIRLTVKQMKNLSTNPHLTDQSKKKVVFSTFWHVGGERNTSAFKYFEN